LYLKPESDDSFTRSASRTLAKESDPERLIFIGVDYDNDCSFFLHSPFIIHNSPLSYDLHSHKTFLLNAALVAHSRIAGQVVN